MPRRSVPSTAAAALDLLAEQTAERDENLQKYDDSPSVCDSDEEPESQSPVVDRFYEKNGNQAVHKMTNFTLPEFNSIWNQSKQHICQCYNTGRGSKSPIKPKDLLFMTLAVLKHGAKWDLMAYLFGFKAATFEKRVSAMIRLLSEFMFCRFVEQYAERYSLERFIADKTTFKTYTFCRYATDVTFQQTYRPGGTLEEVKKYFSGKHKLYGFKVEVSMGIQVRAVSTIGAGPLSPRVGDKVA